MSEITLDIINLIEKNPITRFNSNDYNNKLVEKIKNEFTDTQQQLFLGSFYCYLNYNEENDFVIDLENVWKWCGFSRKDHAKTLLEKYFVKDVDYYTTIAPEAAEAKNNSGNKRGGKNKEKIIMNIKTFKKFCLKANTKKADEIHDYYIKLEKILHETLQEESEELRNKLQTQTKLIEKQNEELSKLKKVKDNLYIGHTDVYKHMTKIGITDDLARRLESHKSSNPHFKYLYTYQTENAEKIEYMVKILLKNFKTSRKKEIYYNITYDQIKQVTDFVILMYDNYKIHESVYNLINFTSICQKTI